MDKKSIIITITIILILTATTVLIFNKSNESSNSQKTNNIECNTYDYGTCPEKCIRNCIGSCPICDDCGGTRSCTNP